MVTYENFWCWHSLATERRVDFEFKRDLVVVFMVASLIIAGSIVFAIIAC